MRARHWNPVYDVVDHLLLVVVVVAHFTEATHRSIDILMLPQYPRRTMACVQCLCPSLPYSWLPRY